MLCDQFGLVYFFRLEKLQKLVEIALIGLQRAHGQTTLIFKINKEIFNVPFHQGSAYTRSPLINYPQITQITQIMAKENNVFVPLVGGASRGDLLHPYERSAMPIAPTRVFSLLFAR